MTLRLALQIDGDAQGAKQAISSANRELEQLSALAKKADADLARAARAVNPDFARLNGVLSQAQIAFRDMEAQAKRSSTAIAANDNSIAGAINGIAAAVQKAAGSTNLISEAASRIAGFVTPTSAVGLALNVAAAAAAFFFSTLQSEAPTAEQSLAEHARLVGVVRDAYRGAANEAGQFLRQSREVTLLQAQQTKLQLEGTLRSQSRTAIGAVTNERVTGLTDSGGGGLPEVPMMMPQGIEAVEQYRAFDDVIQKFNRSLEAGTPDLVAFRDEVAKIGLAAAESDPKLAAQANKLLENTKAAGDTAYGIRQADASIRLMTGAATESDRALLGLSNSAKTAASSSREAANEFTRAERTLRRQTEALEAEAGAFGQTAVEAARYKAEQQLLNAAQAAGVQLSPEVVGSIQAQADRYAEATARVKELAERRQAIDMLRDQTKSFIGDLKTGLQDGANFFDAFASAAEKALDRIADKMLDMAINDLFASFGGSQGGGLGPMMSLFGFGGNNNLGGASSTYGMGGYTVPVFHDGRVPGIAPKEFRNVHPGYYENAPRFHQGRLPWGAGELPAIIRDDELIIPPEKIRKASPGDWSDQSAAPTVNHFHIQTPNPRAFSEDRPAIMRGANRMMMQAGRYT